MQDSFEHCAALVRSADKDRFIAALFAPAEQRRALFALYAFDLELARVSFLVKETLAGEIRLQWWLEAASGRRNDEAQGQPVASALREVIERYDLPRRSFEQMIEARRLDLNKDPIRNMSELENYCRATSSTVITLAARVLEPRISAADLAFADLAGSSLGITGLLRAFPFAASRGHVSIPQEILDRHRLDTKEVLAGRSVPGLLESLAELRAQARLHFEAARGAITEAPARVIPAWLPASLIPRYLRVLDRGSAEPFRSIEVPQWIRQWIMWRAARSGRLGKQ
jgi:phytoene synthase